MSERNIGIKVSCNQGVGKFLDFFILIGLLPDLSGRVSSCLKRQFRQSRPQVIGPERARRSMKIKNGRSLVEPGYGAKGKGRIAGHKEEG